MKATDPTPAAPDTHEELGMYLHLTEQTLLHEAERAGLTKPTPIITWWDLTQQERDLKIHAGRALFDYGREEYEQLGAEHAASRALQVAVRILRGRFPGSPSPGGHRVHQGLAGGRSGSARPPGRDLQRDLPDRC